MHPISRKYIERNAEVELDTEFDYINYDSVNARYGFYNYSSGRRYILRIYDKITEIRLRMKLEKPQDMYELMEKVYPLLLKVEKERIILRGIKTSSSGVYQWLSFYTDQKKIYETVPSASFIEQAGPYEHVLRQYEFYKSIVDNYSKKLYESHYKIAGYHEEIQDLGFTLHSKWT